MLSYVWITRKTEQQIEWSRDKDLLGIRLLFVGLNIFARQ